MKNIPFSITQKLSFCFPNMKIYSSNPVGGGDISRAVRLETSEGKFFLKYNSNNKFSDMFCAEKQGLELLYSAKSGLIIPKPIICESNNEDSFILMEFIESNLPEKNFWINFSSRLASLHKKTSAQFGLDFDNYMGSLKQSNKFHSDWVSFYIEERILIQFEMAVKNGFIDSSIRKQFNSFCNKLSDLIPAEKPSLIHGDLWAGNYMSGTEGKAAIFDPACYYGHRESDIAMTKLFGGFSNEFYDGYNEAYALVPGWKNRTDIFNIYPLLIHVNIFGYSYVYDVIKILYRIKNYFFFSVIIILKLFSANFTGDLCRNQLFRSIILKAKSLIL